MNVLAPNGKESHLANSFVSVCFVSPSHFNDVGFLHGPSKEYSKPCDTPWHVIGYLVVAPNFRLSSTLSYSFEGYDHKGMSCHHDTIIGEVAWRLTDQIVTDQMLLEALNIDLKVCWMS